MDSRFQFRISQGIGIRNLTTDFSANYQFRQFFSIGIGNGFHRNKVNIYSTSGYHKLELWSYPIYLTANIYLTGTSEKAWYIYGRYGRSFGINNKNNDPSKSFKGVMVEGGIGFELLRDDRSIYFELGQYFTNNKGLFRSTYESEINYDLEIYSLALRVGVKF